MTNYIELVLYKTYADLRAEAERTYLGFLWWIIEPILFMGVFYVVFGLLLERGTADFVPFLLIGLTVWKWFNACLMHGALSIMGGQGLMQQVFLPKVIFPIVLILTDTVKFLLVFALLLVFLWWYGFDANPAYLALPVVMAVQLAFITALAFILAAVVPFVPDLRFVVDNLILMAFFTSGVMIPKSVIPEQYLSLFYLNPMANIIESYRDVLMYAQWPHWEALGVIAVVSLLVMVLGARLIRRFEYIYPRINL